MPLLSIEHQSDLLRTAAIHGICRECGHHTAMEYCRSCDQFFWLHAPGCTMYDDGHFGHRLTITPFVEGDGAGRGDVRQLESPEIIFFQNGVTAVTRNGQQEKKLQQSWAELFAEWLVEQGEDPTAFRLFMPSAREARYVRTSDGWTWKFLEKEQ